MKKLLCAAIANAGPEIVSHESHSEWYRASQLEREAETAKSLLWTLLQQFNSAVEPQASIYNRIDRIHEKAIARARRRSIAECIAMYRAMGRTADQVTTNHVFYREIVAALQNDEVTT